jgi:uncharacterized protein
MITQLIVAAFAMGLLGSFHCVGMCGPLALSLPLQSDSYWAKFSGAFLYNAGRVITYAVFGLVFGAVGKTVALFGYQQWISIILGVLILIFIILPRRVAFMGSNNYVTVFFEKLRAALGALFFKKNYRSLFFIGLLNGLLPCGLVYMAAAGAVATGSIINSIVFMAFFGMGTLPVMWSIAFFGNYIGIEARKKIKKVYPYMMMLMACLLILRGMGLGIPYVSPDINAKQKMIQGCYAKPGKVQE